MEVMKNINVRIRKKNEKRIEDNETFLKAVPVTGLNWPGMMRVVLRLGKIGFKSGKLKRFVLPSALMIIQSNTDVTEIIDSSGVNNG